MNNPTTPSTQKMRLYLRIAALFFFITAVIATFVVWGSTYTNDQPEYYDYANNDIYYAPSYEHENNAEDAYYYYERTDAQDYDVDQVIEDEDFYLPEYIYDGEWVNDIDNFSEGNYSGIMPLLNFGDPYPGSNVRLQITSMLTALTHWPAQDTPMWFEVPPSTIGVSLSGRFPSCCHFPAGHPGLPVRAGHTLHGWAGSLHSGPPTNTLLTTLPSAVPGLGAQPSSANLPLTSWRGNNIPNAAHYPMYVALVMPNATSPLATSAMTAIFMPVQLDMPDVNINNDNFLVIEYLDVNPSPPPRHLTQAIVNQYNPLNFIARSRVASIMPNLAVAPLQFKLQSNDVFEFYPSAYNFSAWYPDPNTFSSVNVSGSSDHVTTEYLFVDFIFPVQAAGHANIPLKPALGLGVGSHSDIVTIYQRGYMYCFEGSCNYENCTNDDGFAFHWHDALALSDVADIHPLTMFLTPDRKTEFEVFMEVLRPAIAVDITDAETPSRESTVYVWYAYESAVREVNPIAYNHNNTTPGFTSVPHPTTPSDRIVSIPPPRYTFFYYGNDYNPLEPGYNPNRHPLCFDTGTPLPISPPPGYAIIDAYVEEVGEGDNLIVRLRPIHTVTFYLRGGYTIASQTDPVVRINRLQGLPIHHGDGGVTGHAVPEFPFFNNATFNNFTIPQRGVPDPDPTRINSRFRGWREISATGQILNPGGPLLSSAQVAALTVTGDRFFEAVYSLYLEFYKTDYYIRLDHTVEGSGYARNTLAGAVFELRQMDNTVLYTTPITTGDGLVIIGGGASPPILPSAPPGTVVYRLVETIPPPGRAPGSWTITIDVATGEILSITSEGTSPDFVWRPLPGISGGMGGLGYIGEAPTYSGAYGASHTTHNTTYDGYIGNAPNYDGQQQHTINDGYHCAVVHQGVYEGIVASGGYIPIVPTSIVEVLITSPQMLYDEITAITPGSGNTYHMRIDFPANIATSTDVPPIMIPANVSVIVDSTETGANQVWNRNQATGRHFNVFGGSLELRNVTLSRSASWAAANSGAVSGGVQVIGSSANVAQFTMSHDDATISNNRAASSGGGAVIGANSTFIMTGGNIINNVANSNVSPGNMPFSGGGGLHFDGGLQLINGTGTPTNITITGGRISGNISYGYGGGISMCCSTHTTLSGDVQIYGNTAHIGGGGINMGGRGVNWNNNYLVINNNAKIHANRSNQNGGGIHGSPLNASFITMNGGSISSNAANENGGGVFVASSGFTMHGGIISRNWAGDDGGGLYVAHNNNELIPSVVINAGGHFMQNVAGNGMRVNRVTAAENPNIVPGRRTVIDTPHAFTNHDINSDGPEYAWHVGNRWNVIRFEFIKHIQGQIHNPLDGATFLLERYENGTWVNVATATSSSTAMAPTPHGYVTFNLMPGRRYRLTETTPPTGYQVPVGRWEINAPLSGDVMLANTGFYVGNVNNPLAFTFAENEHPRFDRYMLHLANIPIGDAEGLRLRKMCWNLYTDLPNAVGLAGAQFRFRQVTGPPPITGVAGQGTLLTSDANGFITLPAMPYSTYWVLEEVVPPAGRALPAVPFWTFRHGSAGVVALQHPGTEYENPEVVENVAQSDWAIGNLRGPRFEFLKTNYNIYNDPDHINLLAGAQFRVFRAPIESVNASTGLITITAGVPNAPWEPVADANIVNMTSTTNPNQPVAFYMTRPGFVYQIVEIAAPPGFQVPFVQWRISYNNGVFEDETIGVGYPQNDFRDLDPCDCGAPAASCPRGKIIWFLGNHREFELPLTGGMGMSLMLVAAGTLLIAAAAVMIIVVKLRKNNDDSDGIYIKDGKQHRFARSKT